MKKKFIIYLIIIVVLLTGGCFLFLRKGTKEVKVETVQVKTGNISNTVTATGTVEPITQVEIGTQVSGVIKKIYVDYNTEVKKGQILAELDKTSLQAIVTESQASLNSAKNELDYQQKNYDRISKLYAIKTVSQTDYEEALYKLNNAKATVDQKNSELKRARTNLSYASIYSPIDGVVISKEVDEGQTVAASYSTPTLFTIAQDLTKMQVEASIDEADIGQVKTGQNVSFTVDAYPDETFSGTVTQVRKEAVEESNVVTYTVIIEATNPEGKLMPGLTASVSIVTQEVKEVLTIASKALRFEPTQEAMEAYLEGIKQQPDKDFQTQNGQKLPKTDGIPVQTTSNPATEEKTMDKNKKTVWIKEGTFIHPVTVKTGMTDGTITEVQEGLKAGSEVVTSMEIADNSTTTTNESTSGSSPFMPTPPKRSGSKQGGPPPQ